MITFSFSREMMVDKKMVLHCTAKFCGGSFQFKKKSSDINPSLKEYVNKVQENLGSVQRLKIIGYFFTKETVGCRVQLDCDQLECYDQKEKLNSSDMKRQYGPAPKTTETKNNVRTYFIYEAAQGKCNYLHIHMHGSCHI